MDQETKSAEVAINFGTESSEGNVEWESNARRQETGNGGLPTAGTSSREKTVISPKHRY